MKQADIEKVALAKSRTSSLLYKYVIETDAGGSFSDICEQLSERSGENVEVRWFEDVLYDEPRARWNFSLLRFLPITLEFYLVDAITFFEKMIFIFPDAEVYCRSIIGKCQILIGKGQDKITKAVVAKPANGNGNGNGKSEPAIKSPTPIRNYEPNPFLLPGEVRSNRLGKRREFINFLKFQAEKTGLSFEEFSCLCCGHGEFLSSMEDTVLPSLTRSETEKIAEKLKFVQNRRLFIEFFRLGLMCEAFSKHAVKKLCYLFFGKSEAEVDLNEIIDLINKEEGMPGGNGNGTAEHVGAYVDPKAFGAFFKQARTNAGFLTQTAFQEKSGVLSAIISHFECGRFSLVSTAQFEKILEALDVPDKQSLLLNFRELKGKPKPTPSSPEKNDVPAPSNDGDGNEKHLETVPVKSHASEIISVSAAAKIVLRDFLLGFAGREGIPSKAEIESGLKLAGLGSEDPDNEIRIMQLRELCGKLRLSEMERGFILELLRRTQKEFVLTVEGTSNLIEKIMF